MKRSEAIIYKRPPITEAVIEIKVNVVLATENMGKIARKLKKVYPAQQLYDNLGVQITHQPTVGQSVAINKQSQSYILSTNDQANKAIISQNSLTIARLAPYQGWNTFYEQFITAWKCWKNIAKTNQIVRIGVRYINRIDIPLTNEKKIDLEEYLTFYPKVPELGDTPMSEYLIQVTQPITDSLWSATITSTPLISPLINHISLLLDVDIFRTSDISCKDEDLFAIITEARDIKNTVFESCITPKARELFN